MKRAMAGTMAVLMLALAVSGCSGSKAKTQQPATAVPPAVDTPAVLNPKAPIDSAKKAAGAANSAVDKTNQSINDATGQ